MDQDNESFRDRVSQAVISAVMEAGRAHPDARDLHIDMAAAMDGICHAMALLAASVGQLPEDREHGVKLIEAMADRIEGRLKFLAEQVRSGSLSAHPPERPKPKLVE